MSTSATDPPACHLLWRRVVTAAWLVNVAIVLGIIGWIVVDVSAGDLLQRQWTRLLPHWHKELTDHEIIIGVNRRITWLAALRVGAIVSAAGILAGLIWGAPRQRRIAAWLAATALAAGWLATLTSTSELTWLGQRRRAASEVPKIESLADDLRRKWPEEDGVSEPLGPYSLYSSGTSSILTPLTNRSREKSGVEIVSVERSPAGALQFEVPDQRYRVWLEWHPEGSEPASFVGGLEAYHELKRSSSLGNGWYATRYVVRRDDEITF